MRHGSIRHHTSDVFLMLGIVLIGCGCGVYLRHALTSHAYARLRDQASAEQSAAPSVSQDASEEQACGKDWELLRSQSADVAAWLSVEGTSIDLPVMRTSPTDEDFYLSHDFWGSPSLEGVPFLDVRCQPDDAHRLVYGHHLSMGGQFSELQKAYRQAAFDEIGPCHWSTPANGEEVFAPLCAQTADAWTQGIQRFSFGGQDDLRGWLGSIANASSARATRWKALAASATSAITLVTCTSDGSGGAERTLVTFVATSAAPCAHTGTDAIQTVNAQRAGPEGPAAGA